MVKKVLFFIIFLLALILRAQETLSHNFLFLLDQGRDMLAVKNIIYGYHLTLIGPYTSLQGVFQGPLWYYMLAAATILTHGDPWGGVVLSLLISLATVVVAFLFARKIFGQRSGFVLMFLLAVSPEAIAAATYAWNPHPMWLLLTIYIFSFYLLLEGKKKFNFVVWSTIALMFSFQTALGTFIFLGSIVYLALFNRQIFKTKEFLFGILLFPILLAPQIFFDLRHNFLMTKSILHLFAATGNKGGFIKRLGTTLADHFYNFTINFNSSFNGLIFSGIAFYLLVFGILFGKKTKLLNEKEQSFIVLVTRLGVIIFLLLLFYQQPLRAWFLTGFEIMFLFPLGIILSKFWDYAFGKAIIVILLVTALLTISPWAYNLYKHPDYGGVAKIKGKLDAIDYIYKDAGGRPFNLLVFAPPVYTDNYDYLVFWRAKTTYHYMPGKEKNGTFYLLIEPDSSRPWSYKGWLETVIKSGKVLWTKTLSSGLIVQKRLGF